MIKKNIKNFFKSKSFEDKFYYYLGIKGTIGKGFFSGALWGRALSYYKKRHFTPIDREDNAKDLYMSTVHTLLEKTRQGKIKLDKFIIRTAYVVMRNIYIDLFRKKEMQKKHIDKVDQALYLKKNSSAENLIEDKEESAIIYDCITKLGEFCQKLLKIIRDTKHKKKTQIEISKELNISQGHVSRRTKRCIKELNKIKERYYGQKNNN